jgi:hypothetical protein
VKGDHPNRAARAAKKKTMNTDHNSNQTQSGLSNRPEQLSPDTNPHKEAATPEEAFGPVIYSYTRADALDDGEQVEVTDYAIEVGIGYRVFLTRSVFDAFVSVPAGVEGQDQPGRLWDVVTMLRYAIIRAPAGASRIPFSLYVRNDNRRCRLVKLVAECGPLDIDDPSPAITVMRPTED